jgi:CRISPR type III-A-associated RAMP protein Csm5
MDYIPVMLREEPHLAILSEDKIGKLVNRAVYEKWIEAIVQRESMVDFMRRHVPHAKSVDYSKRRIPTLTYDIADRLKEQIHNGMALPYIPGSSIKGAIRTALLSEGVNGVSGKETKVWTRRRTISAGKIERELFGSDPGSDVFRFIQVGDAYFKEGSEVAIRLVSLNIRQQAELLDKKKSELVEAIGEAQTASFRMKIKEGFYRFTKERCKSIGTLPVHSLPELFPIINRYTRRLVKEEIKFWSQIDKIGAEAYVENMQWMLEAVNACPDEQSCVLRIGHTSGWRFITGAWSEKLSNFKADILPFARAKDWNYVQYDFPKLRRVGECCELLGFVKLTLLA